MSNHQKRLSAPDAWPVERKTETFTVKAAPGPHGESGVPLLILLRDVLGYVDSRKEARYALDRGQVRINGDPVSEERRPVGIFDVLTFAERDEHYRVFPGEGGRLALTPLAADDAGSRLGKVTGKRAVSGGRTQVTLHDGATLHVDREVAAGDSLILDVETNAVVARFPYEEGALVTAVDGRHSGEIGELDRIDVTPGSNPNSVRVETADGSFETVEEYVVVIDENFVDDATVLPGHEPDSDDASADESDGADDASAADDDASATDDETAADAAADDETAPDADSAADDAAEGADDADAADDGQADADDGGDEA